MTVKADLYALVKVSIGNETLVFADQNSPRPSLPYWTLRVQVRNKVGVDAHSQGVSALGDETVSGVRELTVHVQRLGEDSDAKCADLQDDLSRTTILEQWRAKHFALYDVGKVMNIPSLFNQNQLEPRASIDLFVRFGTTVIDRVGIIETVNSTGTLDESSALTLIASAIVSPTDT